MKMVRRRKHDILHFQEHFKRDPIYTTILTQALMMMMMMMMMMMTTTMTYKVVLKQKNTVASSYNPSDSMGIQ
jgi:hypothetical protein